MKSTLVTTFFIIFMLLEATVVSAKDVCFSRSYGALHFVGANKHQSFKKMDLVFSTNTFDGKTENAVFLKAFLRRDKKNKFDFEASFDYSTKVNGKEVICESLNGEAVNSSAGCITYSLKNGSIYVSPITHLFKDGDAFNETPGVKLVYCDGNWNDGGECVNSKGEIVSFRERQWLPTDKADLGYRLDQVDCSKIGF